MTNAEIVKIINRKVEGRILSEEEICTLFKELEGKKVNQSLRSAFLASVEMNGLSKKEILSVINSIYDLGSKMEFKNKLVVDKHSIGGVPGNRVSLIVVPIIASLGLAIPKTSTSAITSPAGTIDVMNIFSETKFSLDEVKDIVDKENGCIVDSDNLNIASSMDEIIEVQKVLDMDPFPLLIASILSRKKAMGVKHLLIDIPTGDFAKVKNRPEARGLASEFIYYGKKNGINTNVVITPGHKPIGRGFGPKLEAMDALRILDGEGHPRDLFYKSLGLCNGILEMVGVRDAIKKARVVVEKGKAMEKFRAIVKAQGGDPKIKISDIQFKYTHTVNAERNFLTHGLNNKLIRDACYILGAPRDVNAGVFIHVEPGKSIKKGTKLFSLYSSKESRIDKTLKFLSENNPIVEEKMILETIRD